MFEFAWILDFLCPFQVGLEKSVTAFRESVAGVADDVYPGTKHNSASVSQLSVFSRENGKQN